MMRFVTSEEEENRRIEVVKRVVASRLKCSGFSLDSSIIQELYLLELFSYVLCELYIYFSYFVCNKSRYSAKYFSCNNASWS